MPWQHEAMRGEQEFNMRPCGITTPDMALPWKACKDSDPTVLQGGGVGLMRAPSHRSDSWNSSVAASQQYYCCNPNLRTPECQPTTVVPDCCLERVTRKLDPGTATNIRRYQVYIRIESFSLQIYRESVTCKELSSCNKENSRSVDPRRCAAVSEIQQVISLAS